MNNFLLWMLQVTFASGLKKNTSISVKLKVASALMLLTLLWLTVSIPFVYKAQQMVTKEKIASAHSQCSNDDESTTNPLTNTNEEKNGNSVNTLSEEYLHHHSAEEMNHSIEIIAHLHHSNEATYIAFHGELLTPPPNA